MIWKCDISARIPAERLLFEFDALVALVGSRSAAAVCAAEKAQA